MSTPTWAQLVSASNTSGLQVLNMDLDYIYHQNLRNDGTEQEVQKELFPSTTIILTLVPEDTLSIIPMAPGV